MANIEPTETVPENLDREGRTFAVGVIAEFDAVDQVPDTREHALILAAARQINHVSDLAAALDSSSVLVTGSKGQPVANPLLSAHARAQEVLNSYLHRVRSIVPDAEGAARPQINRPRGLHSVRVG